MNPEGWVDNDEEEGLPDEQHPEQELGEPDDEDDCRAQDLLRMPQENLPE